MKLIPQVRQAIRVKHYSLRTEKSYVNWIKRFIQFHNIVHPAKMGATQVREFLNHLAVKENVAAATQNQALNALNFLYREIIKQDFGVLDKMVWAKKPKNLPVVLSKR